MSVGILIRNLRTCAKGGSVGLWVEEIGESVVSSLLAFRKKRKLSLEVTKNLCNFAPMKLSIKKFKSILELKEFEFSPLTMLTGVNSSGKTSLVQSLLLLKQTLESETKEVLRLDGKYISTEYEHDLVYGKAETDEFGFVIELDHEDLKLLDGYNEKGITHLRYMVDFHVNGGVYVRYINVEVTHNGRNVGIELTARDSLKANRMYDISLRGIRVMRGRVPIDFTAPFMVSFSNFFPHYATGVDGEGEQVTLLIPFIDELTSLLTSYFSRVFYVGPLRIKPEPVISYANGNLKDVGIDGLYTRFVLHNLRDVKVNNEETLLEATRRWVCSELKLAETIETIKDGTNSYRVVLKNKGIEVDLCHMGLGVSQVLPIIVQGLLVPVGGMLVVDSPEVHMHPSVQAGLVDFFIELTKNRRKVVVETHSDHMITRLRRRIAENFSPSEVNLCFVTGTENGSTYQTLGINDQGTFFGGLPEGFMDTQDTDFRKIVEAKFAHPAS